MNTIDASERQKMTARDRILLTAHDLFYREGIRATGIDRVIAEAKVTKVTFYRHFPSKKDLICEYLEYRHRRWMAWFEEALQRHGGQIVPALAEWFNDANFRGCAFINGVGELGGAMPEVVNIARRHKQEMTAVIASLLPASNHREQDAQAVALAIDGAIIQAQIDETPDDALPTLDKLVSHIFEDAKQ